MEVDTRSLIGWCPEPDSNRHVFRHLILSQACLPFHHPGWAGFQLHRSGFGQIADRPPEWPRRVATGLERDCYQSSALWYTMIDPSSGVDGGFLRAVPGIHLGSRRE